MSNTNELFKDIGDKYDIVNVEDSFLKLGLDFRKRCIEYLNQRAVTASGNLEDSIEQPDISISGSKITMTISMADYYDYTNKGVKGWADSSKAPNSPYQFKSKGMNSEGRKSIEQYVRSGAKKVTQFSQAYKELEKKFSRRGGKGLFEFQVNNAIFGIKKKGIRAKRWFDDAVKDVFGDMGEVVAEAFGKDIIVTFQTK